MGTPSLCPSASLPLFSHSRPINKGPKKGRSSKTQPTQGWLPTLLSMDGPLEKEDRKRETEGKSNSHHYRGVRDYTHGVIGNNKGLWKGLETIREKFSTLNSSTRQRKVLGLMMSSPLKDPLTIFIKLLLLVNVVTTIGTTQTSVLYGDRFGRTHIVSPKSKEKDHSTLQ